jgi:protein-tyrosine kinase
MEKIQSAIAKARAEREGQPLPSPAIRRSSRAAAAAAAVAPEPEAAPAVDVAANWAALGQFEPNPRVLQRNRIVAYHGGKEAVHFDVMRTKLLQQMRANNWRRLAITSPGAGCGKSTTCMNLAFSFARQPDVRTIVAEVDLRRPSLAKMLGLRPTSSFAQVLEGAAKFEDNAMRYGANLAFATNASAAKNPSELLQGAKVGQVLADMEAWYEPTVTIFDMPPMLVSDDAMAFVGKVDCVLLVAAAETTTIQEVDVCERDLASQTNVLGVVLNKCRYMDRKYGYSYYG